MYNLDGQHNVKQKKTTKRQSLKKILNEYKLKMNSFHPNDESPNLFVNKLQYRMNHYYNLYKSKNEIMK
tara:strand:- start:316 stop:522 length:207 start_codon:yes stop_codon:yes gene_type:complete